MTRLCLVSYTFSLIAALQRYQCYSSNILPHYHFRNFVLSVQSSGNSIFHEILLTISFQVKNYLLKEFFLKKILPKAFPALVPNLLSIPKPNLIPIPMSNFYLFIIFTCKLSCVPNSMEVLWRQVSTFFSPLYHVSLEHFLAHNQNSIYICCLTKLQ